MRYMQKGITKFRFVPTIASATLVPTAVEVLAGTDVTPQVSEVNGFAFANSPIATPDMASTFTSTVAGEDAADTSSLKFYEDKTTNPIKTALAKGTSGFIVIFFAGTAAAAPAAGDKCDVWPVNVASNVRGYSTGNEVSQYTVTFAISGTPGFDKVLT